MFEFIRRASPLWGNANFNRLWAAQILSAFSTGEGRVAGLWAPNIYTAEERMNAVPLCSGKDADAIVPGNIIVREEFLRANPDMVARYLAVFLRGFAFM